MDYARAYKLRRCEQSLLVIMGMDSETEEEGVCGEPPVHGTVKKPSQSPTLVMTHKMLN